MYGGLVKFREALAVAAERLLDDEPREATLWRASVRLDLLADGGERLRVDRKEEHPVCLVRGLGVDSARAKKGRGQ